MNSYILDSDNRPVRSEEMKAWKWMQEHPHRKIVGKTVFPDGTRVSTVFLSLDHKDGHGDPVLWETMVFDTASDDMYGEFQERYTSYADAVAGHIDIVKKIMERRK